MGLLGSDRFGQSVLNVLAELEGVGLKKEDVGLAGLEGRGSTAVGLSGWMDGWMFG